MGCWTSSGVADFQVKLRGLRIELGEIENVMLQEESVEQAVVVLRRDDRLGDQLVAYVVGRSGASVDAAELTDRARASLTDYMVPSAVVVLDEFPLNPSGKVDRRALPAPVFETETYRAPATPLSRSSPKYSPPCSASSESVPTTTSSSWVGIRSSRCGRSRASDRLSGHASRSGCCSRRRRSRGWRRCWSRRRALVGGTR